MHYVIGDVHGCYQQLMDLLTVIEEKDSDAKYIFVGDFIDRGTGTKEVLEWAMTNITDNGKYQSVRGNHEQMIIDWYYEEFVPWWNRGAYESGRALPETLFDFSDVLIQENMIDRNILQPIIAFFESLPMRKDLECICEGKNIRCRIVHGNDSQDEAIDEQERESLNLWDRHAFQWEKGEKHILLIHGHTPTFEPEYRARGYLPGMVGTKGDSIDVDCGAHALEKVIWAPCMLGAFCIESFKAQYPYTLHECFNKKDYTGRKMLEGYLTHEDKKNYMMGMFTKSYSMEENTKKFQQLKNRLIG